MLEHRLLIPNAVLAYVMDKGSKQMQLWVHSKQRRLKEFIQDALEMANARQAAALERETEWELVERLSKSTCDCGDNGCLWWALASEFFSKNPRIDKERLAAALRKVIMKGPCKEARVPLIMGPSNSAKSTVFDPVKNVFGKTAVLGKPKLGAPNGALSRLAKDDIRFIFFDDYRPVEYAAMPKENPTVPATDFLALFCGQPLTVQVSQSFNDGHPEKQYCKGAAMTAKAEGLWDPCGCVTREEIRHMQARVDVYRATHVILCDPADFIASPACGTSWCRWLVVDSVAFAARQQPCNFSGRTALAPKSLPALPSSGSNVASASVALTQTQRADIAKKKEAAIQRKTLLSHKQAPCDDEDPFGHGGGLD